MNRLSVEYHLASWKTLGIDYWRWSRYAFLLMFCCCWCFSLAMLDVLCVHWWAFEFVTFTTSCHNLQVARALVAGARIHTHKMRKYQIGEGKKHTQTRKLLLRFKIMIDLFKCIVFIVYSNGEYNWLIKHSACHFRQKQFFLFIVRLSSCIMCRFDLKLA